MDGSIGSFDALVSSRGNVVVVMEYLCAQRALWDASAGLVVE